MIVGVVGASCDDSVSQNCPSLIPWVRPMIANAETFFILVRKVTLLREVLHHLSTGGGGRQRRRVKVSAVELCAQAREREGGGGVH